MIVGIDVHKHTHAAALIDEQGRKVGALSLSNSPVGCRRLIEWLIEHQAAEAALGVESPGSYGRSQRSVPASATGSCCVQSARSRWIARCIRELAVDIDDLNHRIAAVDAEIADLLTAYGNPLQDLQGAGTNLTATIIAQAGDVRRSRETT